MQHQIVDAIMGMFCVSVFLENPRLVGPSNFRRSSRTNTDTTHTFASNKTDTHGCACALITCKKRLSLLFYQNTLLRDSKLKGRMTRKESVKKVLNA